MIIAFFIPPTNKHSIFDRHNWTYKILKVNGNEVGPNLIGEGLVVEV